MRPIYETKADLKNENVARRYIRSLGFEPAKLLVRHEIDFAICKKGAIISLLEFKRRKCKANRYKTLMIHKKKHNAALRYKETLNLDTILLIQYNDSLRTCVLNKVDFTLGHGGRFDRNDPEDYEEMIFIKKEDLKKVVINEWKTEQR